MRKEIGKALRYEFAKRMKTEYPKFKPYTSSAYRGDRVFLWQHSDHIYLFLILAIHHSFDLFNIMIGWSEAKQIPYTNPKAKDKIKEQLIDLGFAIPDNIKSQSKEMKPLTEFRLDPRDFLEGNTTPWEQLGLSSEEYIKKLEEGLIPDDTLSAVLDEWNRKDPVEDCINRINPCLDNAMAWLSMYGMPYLSEKIFKHTGIRIS